MSFQGIRTRASILAAIKECRSIGRAEFLTKYGFRESTAYFLSFEGELFDSKAIVGVAHGFEFPELGPLRSNEFSGGLTTVQRKLEELGFTIQYIPKGSTPQDPLSRWSRELGEELESAGEFSAQSEEDSRKRVLASIVRRRGQPEFRAKILAAYKGCCALTGCVIEAVLEAAHIVPYRGDHTNVTVNGILLRADVHTLFDLGLIGIDPASLKVVIAPALRNSDYSDLAGRVANTPSDSGSRPDASALKARFEEFVRRHQIR